MKSLFGIVSLWGVLMIAALSQDENTQAVPLPDANSTLPDDGTRVAVLGYHDFSETERETAMRIRTSKFREQMEALRELEIEVISMADFIAWKDGGKRIPAKAAVITIDDGWKSVYTEAYPVLKEMGYPFTLYLYKDYVDGGGKALTTAMIREMMKHGANLGSHSSSHPFPQTVKKYRDLGPDAFDQFLDKEMLESKRYLETKFNTVIPTFAYPGGFFTKEMLGKAEQVGYSHLFTVQPAKVKRDLPNSVLPRYIILGDYDKIFAFATSFGESRPGMAAPELSSFPKKTQFPVSPQPGAIINSRLPVIEVDFTKAENLDPESLKMHVAGFGEVPAHFDRNSKTFSWPVNRHLRHKICRVIVTWKDSEGIAAEKPLDWRFQIDRGAAYLPDE
jgi:peptidoglycan/xylan/chitin deacetylase (PgdA/CDA1 family)